MKCYMVGVNVDITEECRSWYTMQTQLIGRCDL